MDSRIILDCIHWDVNLKKKVESHTKDRHFVWLEVPPMVETLIKLVHYSINISLTISNIILC